MRPIQYISKDLTFINFFSTTTSSDLSQSDIDVALELNDDALLPEGVFILVFESDSGEREIVEVTKDHGCILLSQRALEDTTAKAWPAGTRVEMRLTAEIIQCMYNAAGNAFVAASYIAPSKLTIPATTHPLLRFTTAGGAIVDVVMN